MMGGHWMWPVTRLAHYLRTDYTCYLCGADLTRTPDGASLDHVIPRNAGTGWVAWLRLMLGAEAPDLRPLLVEAINYLGPDRRLFHRHTSETAGRGQLMTDWLRGQRALAHARRDDSFRAKVDAIPTSHVWHAMEMLDDWLDRIDGPAGWWRPGDGQRGLGLSDIKHQAFNILPACKSCNVAKGVVLPWVGWAGVRWYDAQVTLGRPLDRGKARTLLDDPTWCKLRSRSNDHPAGATDPASTAGPVATVATVQGTITVMDDAPVLIDPSSPQYPPPVSFTDLLAGVPF